MGEHSEAIVEQGHECGNVEAVYDKGLKVVDGVEVWDIRLQGVRQECKFTRPYDQMSDVS